MRVNYSLEETIGTIKIILKIYDSWFIPDGIPRNSDI